MTSLAAMPSTKVRRIIYFGTPEVAVAPLQALVTAGFSVELVVTRPDARRGRGGEPSPSPVKRAAQNLGLKVSHSIDEAIRSTENQSDVLGVVVAFGEIFKTSALQSLPMINVHFSLLPRWRGAAPVERAILAGDKTTGVCIIRVGEALDEGEIYASEEIEIADHDDLSTLRKKLNDLGIQLLLQTLDSGFASAATQVGTVTYAKKISPADLHIDWQESSSKILRQIRVGGAFTILKKKRVKIVSASRASATQFAGEPGELVNISKTSFDVVCGEGAISVSRVQPEGKDQMTAEQWLNGARLKPGARLGG